MQFALARILYLACFNSIALAAPLTSSDIASGEISTALLSLYLNAVAYYLLAAYLEEVLPRTYGVRKHPLFCIPQRWWRFNLLRGVRPGSSTSGVFFTAAAAAPPIDVVTGTAITPHSSPSAAAGTAAAATGHQKPELYPYIGRWAAAAGLRAPDARSYYAAGEDEDVRAERIRVDAQLAAAAGGATSTSAAALTGATRSRMALFQAYPVILQHLRKEFTLEAQARAAMNKAAAAGAGSAASMGGGTHRTGGGGSGGATASGSGGGTSSSLLDPVDGSGEGDNARPSLFSSSSASLFSLASAASRGKGGKEDVAPLLSADYSASDNNEFTAAPSSSMRGNAAAAAAAAPAVSGPVPVSLQEGGIPSADWGLSGDGIDGGSHYSDTEQTVLQSVLGVKVAVSDLSLAVPAGTCFGLLGENGESVRLARQCFGFLGAICQIVFSRSVCCMSKSAL